MSVRGLKLDRSRGVTRLLDLDRESSAILPPITALTDIAGCVLWVRHDLGLTYSGMATFGPWGTNPLPIVTGTPDATVQKLRFRIDTAGNESTMRFSYSLDGGSTFSATQVPSHAYVIGTTGLTVDFPVGAYAAAVITEAYPDGITQWSDQSGLGHHLLPVAAKPGRNKLAGASLNGKIPIGFLDLSSNNQRLQAAAFNTPQPHTLFIVGRQGNTTASKVWTGGTTGATNLVFSSAAPANAGTAMRLNAGITLNEPTLSTIITNYHYHTAIFNGATSKLKVDSVEKVSGNGGSNAATGFTIGAPAGGGTGSLIDILEVGMFSGILSAIDEQRVYSYFQAAYLL